MNHKKKLSILLLLIALIVIIRVSKKCNSPKIISSKTRVKTLNDIFLNKPIKSIDIPYQVFTLDSKCNNKLLTDIGTSINVPKNAFLDENGKIYSKQVVISYREFRNPVDFYIAAIPMNYNDKGEDKSFISGGMFEILAKGIDNEPLFVNDKNKIKVDLISWTKSKDFKTYHFNKKEQKWVDTGNDSIKVINKTKQLDELNIPKPPKTASPYSFSIQDDTGNYPELSEYENVKFEPVNRNQCNISNAQEIKIKPIRNGTYNVISILKLGNFRKESSCICYLAFEAGKDYSKALKIYYKKYQNLIRKREKILKEWKDYELALTKLQIKNASTDEKIIRSLQVNQFGLVNLDYPSSYPIGQELVPNFYDQRGNKIHLNEIVLIEKGTNAIYRYNKTIKFNPSKQNILYGIYKDKIVYLKNEELNKYSKKSPRIILKTYQKTIKSYEDVYEFINQN